MAKPGGAGKGAGKGVRSKALARGSKPPSLTDGRPARLAHLVPGHDRQLRRERAWHASVMETPAAASRLESLPPPDASPPSGQRGDILCLPNPEWLPHTLAITGPLADMAAFRVAAAGPGGIPWIMDYDRLAEDWVNLMLMPPPSERGISVEGARLLAGQLRERVELENQRGAAAASGSPSCPLDLHALIPVPARLLRLGPADPAAIVWLWENWGTTWALRGVEETSSDQRAPPPADHGSACYQFWSADWTPWRALAAVRSRWPRITLQVSVRSVSE